MRTISRAATILLPAILLTATVLSGCGKDAPQPPEAYVIGEDSAPPLDQMLTEDNGSLVAIEEPKEDASSGTAPVYVYRYEKIAQVNETVKAYAEWLTTQDSEFNVMDEAAEVTEMPDLLPTEGTLRVAKSSAVEKHIFAIDLAWKDEECTVTVSQPEGRITEPVEPMTISEAISYFKKLEPADVGLTGDKMSDYQIYLVDGLVFVDNRACLKFSIYNTTDPQLTGQVQGIYLMTGDKKYLYRLDQKNETITQLLPKTAASSDTKSSSQNAA